MQTKNNLFKDLQVGKLLFKFLRKYELLNRILFHNQNKFLIEHTKNSFQKYTILKLIINLLK